jgi:hypothetical protein
MPYMADKDFRQPKYPEITQEQWTVLQAMTPQGCANLLEARDFVADLSPEAKDWLKKADKEKIAELNSTISFNTSTKIIWRFFYIGGGMVVAAFVAVKMFWTTFGEIFTVKMK